MEQIQVVLVFLLLTLNTEVFLRVYTQLFKEEEKYFEDESIVSKCPTNIHLLKVHN